jgi:hypothetical protein
VVVATYELVMVTGKLQISFATVTTVTSMWFLVGSLAAAGCAMTPMALNASTLSTLNNLNLGIILAPSSLR